ncbi:hypothetical protein L3X39_00025 [Sabulilitoribacter multivorans]|uniref:DoxX family protein n=1 Tax=Flaviramulus multivorans TaxID=1304750 RepID=A0ABS9IDX5_9FLAO|nr:hypothetical protein [Flaviramulus multivorans]MCF7559006.1 hypothetical protein [Flaviramulus multivorans]
MTILIVLIAVSSFSYFMIKAIKGTNDFSRSARVGMSTMLVFTALGHFLFAEGMTLMIPSGIPYKRELVYITGVLEIFVAIGLQISSFRKVIAWLLIIFFILILPANINASLHQLNYQTGTFDGYGLTYLWFRIPLQVFFIGWIYFSSIRPLKGFRLQVLDNIQKYR